MRFVRQARRMVSPSTTLVAAIAALSAAACTTSTSQLASTASVAPSRSSGGAPNPDPRVGLKAGLYDAGMATWNEPASACLSSRIPYHSEVTEAKLRTIDGAEGVLRRLGFRVFRVRHHDTIARLELGRDEIARALEPAVAERIDAALRALGYAHVTVDLRGYRLGSLNDALKLRPV